MSQHEASEHLLNLQAMSRSLAFDAFVQRWREKVRREVAAKALSTATTDAECRILREVHERITDGWDPAKMLEGMIAAAKTEATRASR